MDDNFGPYLSSLNVPEFLHELIANAGETIEVVEPKDSGGMWKIRKVAGKFSPDFGFVTLGLRKSGCKFALSPPTVGRKAQICTLIHSNLVSQIPNLVIAVEDQMHSIYKGMKSK